MAKNPLGGPVGPRWRCDRCGQEWHEADADYFTEHMIGEAAYFVQRAASATDADVAWVVSAAKRRIEEVGVNRHSA